MEISNTLPPAYSASSDTSQKTSSDPAISSDFETFLRMLTAQMQNQDPLNPVDSTDYATQLATFSSVEQQVLSNDLLRNISTALDAGGLSQLSGWVGMEALSTAPAHFSGTPISLRPEIPADAAKTELVVKDGSGAVVERQNITGETGVIEWSGSTINGNQAATGSYGFELSVSSKDGETEVLPVPTYDRIVEARTVAGTLVLGLESGTDISADDVAALRST